ncbi:MAG TPA: esterase-like activity of phytase family protein, partial [Salinarimonas sp.]|nr:esterase-like activity of phytase family protein [Salinarimonas sp.]
MRLTRRRWLALAGLGALGGTAALGLRHRLHARSSERLDGPTPVAIRAEPIPAFGPDERVGALRFRAGLALASPHGAFGGFSGLWRAPDGGSLVAISDDATWLTARVAREAGRLSGLDEARLAPVLGPDGTPLARGPAYDTEALAIHDGVAYVGIERAHGVMRFAFAQAGVLARGVPLPVPPEAGRLPANAGLEAIAVHPGDGSLVAIAEQARPGPDAPTRGFILAGPRPGAFAVARSEGFDVTDLAFLPSGEGLLLERRFSFAAGVAMRLRRIAADAFRPGALVDGPVIARAGRERPIDNMEGLAVHHEDGRPILTLISDDNFSPVQRTVLLEFALED